MRHFASAAFWKAYRDLPPATREAADAAYALLNADPHHPSLRLKRVGAYWSRASACAIALWRWMSKAACSGSGSAIMRSMIG